MCKIIGFVLGYPTLVTHGYKNRSHGAFWSSFSTYRFGVKVSEKKILTDSVFNQFCKMYDKGCVFGHTDTNLKIRFVNRRPTRISLIEQYGTRIPFRDGSIARFIPYIHGKVNNRKKIDDKLFILWRIPIDEYL
jgi:hypothetical protein